MTSLKINNLKYSVKMSIPLIQALVFIGLVVPRFCFHEKLSIASSCRMCLVETEAGPYKLLAACSSDILPNSII